MKVTLSFLVASLVLSVAALRGWGDVRLHGMDEPSTFASGGMIQRLGDGTSYPILEAPADEWVLVRDLEWSASGAGVHLALSLPEEGGAIPLARIAHRGYGMGDPRMVLPPGATLSLVNASGAEVSAKYDVDGYRFGD